MRKQGALTVIFGIFLSLAFCSAADTAERVGYINLQRLVNESKMGKEAKEDIRKLRKEKEDLLALKLKEINKLKQDFNNAENNMTVRQKRAKLEVLKRAYKDYQRLVADSKEDIVIGDRELVAIILEKADSILKKVAKEKNFTIILKDPNAIGYLDPKVDITDDVLRELNREK